MAEGSGIEVAEVKERAVEWKEEERMRKRRKEEKYSRLGRIHRSHG